MTSTIDPTHPATGLAVSKATSRANWTAAKTEIDHGGFTTNTPTNYSAADTQVDTHITGIDTALTTINSDISGNTSSISSNASAISAAQSDITALQSDIAHGGTTTHTPVNYTAADTEVTSHLAGIDNQLFDVQIQNSGSTVVTAATILNFDGAGVTAAGSGSTATITVPGATGSGAFPMINVKDAAYGAIGDGVTDDTTAIQAALNAAPSRGGVIFFPAGSYKVTSTLDVPNFDTTTNSLYYIGVVKAVHLVGEFTPLQGFSDNANYQGASTILWAGSGADPCIDFSGDSGKAWFFGGISDLYIKDTVATQQTIGLKFGRTTSAHFNRVTVSKFYYGVWQVNELFSDPPDNYGVDVGGWYSVWNNCSFGDCRLNGALFQGSHHGVSFRNCRFSASTGAGSVHGFDSSPFKRAGGTLSFIGCYWEQNGARGVEVHNGQAVSFHGCYFENNATADIYASGSDASLALTVVGNHHFWTTQSLSNMIEVNSKSSAKIKVTLIGNNVVPATNQAPAVQLTAGSAANLSISSINNTTGKSTQTLDLYDGNLSDLGGLFVVNCEMAQNQNVNPFLVSSAWDTTP